MKLVFLDIDGTLTLPGENTPPESALAAIRAARARGNMVFLCTGRNLDMAGPLLRLGFDGIIASSGGCVLLGERLLYDCPMSDADRELALETLHRNGVFCTIEAKDGTWGDENLDAFLEGQPEGNSEIERWRKALSESLGIRPMGEYDGRPVYKVVVMCGRMEQLDEAKALLEERYAFVVQEIPAHGCVNGELVNRSFDKGTGVERIADALGVSLADTVGFGDSLNDLEMLKKVGRSVCMGNGAETLKALADVVAPPVSEDGLAIAFEQLGLIQGPEKNV